MNRNGALYLNVVLLALAFPALARLVYEAIYLRWVYGPRMLLWGVFHGSENSVFGTVVVLSLMCGYLFVAVSAITSLLFLMPKFRRRFFGVREIPLMLLAVLVFTAAAVLVEVEPPFFVLLFADLLLIAAFLFVVAALMSTVRLAIENE